MFENVDGVYAEMGDSDADNAAGGTDITSTATSLGSLNAHAIGTALATTGPMVNYIWNHPKPQAKMSVAYVSRSLMTHMWAGVFPTIPVHNNDHAIGGDCAPGCSYDAAYAAYGPVFDAMRGRQWSLSANAAEVMTKNALSNLFFKRLGTSDLVYMAPIAFAPLSGEVRLTLRGMVLTCEHPKLTVITPANHPRATTKLLNTTQGPKCDHGWGAQPEVLCSEISVQFSSRESITTEPQDRPASGATLMIASC